MRFSELLEVNKKESLISSYRTPDCEPIIVSPGTGPCVRFARLEGIPGIEHFVDEIVVNSPMVLVGSRLHRDIEHAATHLAILRRIVASLNRNFLDRVDAGLRLRGNAWCARIRRILAFNTEGLCICRSSVETDQRVRRPCAARYQLNHCIWIPNAGTSRKYAAYA